MFMPLILAAAAGAVVWPVSSLENVYPTTPPASVATLEIQAARGEWESLQLCVHNDGAAAIEARIDATEVTGDIPAPSIYVVDFVTLPPGPTHPLGPLRVPDRLLPNAPLTIAPGETRSFWLTYRIPVDAVAGEYEGEVIAILGETEKRLPVTCKVFGFSLPPLASLRSLMPLNRANVANVLDLSATDLDAWLPVYDAIRGYRLAFSIWDDPGTVPRLDDGTVDTQRVQEHLLHYGAGTSALDVGFGFHGIAPVATANDERFIPAQDVYLYDMGHWLRSLDWTSRAVVMLPGSGSRARWQGVREQSFSIFKAESGIGRILSAPLHPFFERYVDIWALTLGETNPLAIARIRDGQSLYVSTPAAAPVLSASGSGHAIAPYPYETRPADAYDGSFFSHWVSARGPKESYPWLEIDFDRQVATQELRIGWVPGYESRGIRLRTSFDGRTFSTADVRWESMPPSGPFEPSWSVGHLATEKKFVSLRLEFRDQVDNAPVAIADILVARALEDKPAPIARIQPWLATAPGDFPFLGLPGNPAEPRLLPWVCWAHRLLGLLHSGAAHWPPAWDGNAFPEDWPTEQVLFYPANGGMMPSVRLMRLRDGMEDYEYLRNLEQMAMIFGALRDPEIDALRRHEFYAAELPYVELHSLEKRLLARRAEIAAGMNRLLETEAP